MNININGTIAGARLVNTKELEQQLAEAFAEWLEDDVNGEYMSEEFLMDKWPYPPPSTLRQNGEIAGSPRNIYDTGELFRSGQESFAIVRSNSSVEGKWHWDARNNSGEEYAWYVHEGRGPHSRAARPWTDEIAEPYLFEGSDIKRELERRITAKLSVK